MDEEERTKAGPFGDENLSMSGVEPPQPPEGRSVLASLGLDGPVSNAKTEKESRAVEPQDPLAGMPEADKWGFKGLRTLMNNYPDRNALLTGLDPTSLGLDLNSTE